jgi:hypothetical protein
MVFAAAVSEKIASVMIVDFFKQEAAKGHRSDFDRFLYLVLKGPSAAAVALPNQKFETLLRHRFQVQVMVSLPT